MDNLNFSDIEAVKAAFAAIQREKDAEKAQSAEKDKLIAEKDELIAAERLRAEEEKAQSADKDKLIAAEKARADAEKAQSAEKDKLIAEKDELIAAEKARADAEKALNVSTSLHAYLYNLYAHCFQTITVLPPKDENATVPSTTSVSRRNCPRKLLHWRDFPVLHEQKFANLTNAFGNNLLLPCISALREDQKIVAEWTHGSEGDSSKFCSAVIEQPTANIAKNWLKIEPKGIEKIEFRTNMRHIKRLIDQIEECHRQEATVEVSRDDDDYNSSSDVVDIPEPVTIISASASRGRGAPNATVSLRPNLKRPAILPPDASEPRPSKAQSPNRSIKPDGTCVAIMEKTLKDRCLLVIEHKPAHIHTPTLLENALEQIAKSDGSIFLGSMGPESVSGTKKMPKSQKGLAIVAKALVQTYNYMVALGLSYGYISTGECTVLLHIDYEEPSELYFHLCVHQKDVKGIPLRPVTAPLAQDDDIAAALEDGIKNTPCAIIMTMIQLALNQPNLSAQEIASVQKDLPRYPDTKNPPSDPSPGPGKGDGNGGGKGGGNPSLRNKYPLLPPPSGGSSSQSRQDPSKRQMANKHTYMNPGPHRPPQPEYCSQKCLLGVVNGSFLDASCPNSHLHRQYSASSDGKHPLTLAQLVDVIQTQLDTNLDSDCEVQRHKSGLFGTLVKLTAHPYGYTFVGKGMMDLGLPFIHHELQVYSRLRPIQGVFVPVCLGHVSMQQTLNVEFLPIRQMLLMSYAGESVREMGDVVDNIEAQLLALGVVHGDIREENVTYDAMSRQTMLIDFHRSQIFDPAPKTTFVGPARSAVLKQEHILNSWDDGRSKKRMRLEI
ncbi:hypothetical protein HOO65_090210 [Ceratocystis lukuohia]|uniref:Protein kinase domain-containing protein n=1 Tax=Ceratocystis lukuohia TaxID=2019550 RepID=A0ABR4M9G0_9PEZI